MADQPLCQYQRALFESVGQYGRAELIEGFLSHATDRGIRRVLLPAHEIAIVAPQVPWSALRAVEIGVVRLPHRELGGRGWSMLASGHFVSTPQLSEAKRI